MTPYYERGGITVYLGDCLEVLPQLEPVDCVLTDPPYARDVYQRLGMPKTHAGSGTPSRLTAYDTHRRLPGREAITDPKAGAKLGIRNHQYSITAIEKLAAGFIGSVDDLIDPVALELARLARRWALVFSDAETIHRWRAALEGAGMRYVRTGAWVKPDPMPQFSGDRPSVGFEPCTITHAQGPMRWNGGGHAAVWTHNTVKGNGGERHGHPCPKPLSLMRELVALFSDPGETILDPFAGSLTTAVAAYGLGRRCIAIERDEGYLERGVKRLAQMPMDLEAVAAELPLEATS